MENVEEAIRLEVKTDPEVVQRQARWCGLRSGLRVLDAGCGPGKITSILHESIQPGGTIMGVDYSNERIRHAQTYYGSKPGMEFQLCDLRNPIQGIGPFDLIWVRFVLEYNREESLQIVRNLTEILSPGGCLCLLDLDHNCLSHYELTPELERFLFEVMKRLENEFNFDPYSGRKLYSYLYDLGYEDIKVELMAHHLFYGELKDVDAFNWIKKAQVTAGRAPENFANYPRGWEGFFSDFLDFFHDPRRFTYTPLILCKGMKPRTPRSEQEA
jgi:ubiquinone/menaquinone biosynthesis C-methylase UbiE